MLGVHIFSLNVFHFLNMYIERYLDIFVRKFEVLPSLTAVEIGSFCGVHLHRFITKQYAKVEFFIT